MTRVRRPISAARTPVAAATEVFPTPPFPAKKMILNRKLLGEESAFFRPLEKGVRGIFKSASPEAA